MATFSAKPTEGQDPWGATDLAWRSSVEAAVNASEVTIDKSAGIKVSVQDNAAGRKQLIYGDSGWRDISSLLGNGWTLAAGDTSSMIMVRRDGYLVTVAWSQLQGASSSSSDVLTLPAGFRPARHEYRLVAQGPYTSPSMSWVCARGSGAVQMKQENQSLGSNVFNAITFVTGNSWPTTLPGSAVGSIPNA